jgi:hypothetical protein
MNIDIDILAIIAGIACALTYRVLCQIGRTLILTDQRDLDTREDLHGSD